MNIVKWITKNEQPKHTVDESKNYSHNGRVLTGKQVNNLLALSKPVMQAIILLSVHETDEPATNPNSKYGVA